MSGQGVAYLSAQQNSSAEGLLRRFAHRSDWYRQIAGQRFGGERGGTAPGRAEDRGRGGHRAGPHSAGAARARTATARGHDGAETAPRPKPASQPDGRRNGGRPSNRDAEPSRTREAVRLGQSRHLAIWCRIAMPRAGAFTPFPARSHRLVSIRLWSHCANSGPSLNRGRDRTRKVSPAVHPSITRLRFLRPLDVSVGCRRPVTVSARGGSHRRGAPP
jgi:hypothetical protein